MITVKSWLNFKGQEVSYRSTCSTTKRKRKSLWVFILLFDRKGELQKGSPYSSNIRKIRILTHQFSCEPQLAVATSTLNRYDHLKNHCSQEALQHKPLTRNQYSAPTVSKPGNNIQLLPTILTCPDFSQRGTKECKLATEMSSIPSFKHVPGNFACVELGSGTFLLRIGEAQIWRVFDEGQVGIKRRYLRLYPPIKAKYIGERQISFP